MLPVGAVRVHRLAGAQRQVVHPGVLRGALVATLALLVAGCGTRPPAPDAVVTGVALSRERVLVPPDSVFEATLLDVTQPDQPPVVLGRQRQELAGQPPYALRIPYPTVRFMPKGRYEVRATVSWEGRLLLATMMRHPVPQDLAFRRVDVLLHRPPALPATVEASVPLLLTHWRLAQVQEQPVARGSEAGPTPFLVLQGDEARAAGAGGCNRFVADYSLEGANLRFHRLVSGITLCLDTGAAEARYLSALSAVASFRQQGTQLLLRDVDGKPLLRFEAAETPLR